jgi:hypothetical protein
MTRFNLQTVLFALLLFPGVRPAGASTRPTIVVPPGVQVVFDLGPKPAQHSAAVSSDPASGAVPTPQALLSPDKPHALVRPVKCPDGTLHFVAQGQPDPCDHGVVGGWFDWDTSGTVRVGADLAVTVTGAGGVASSVGSTSAISTRAIDVYAAYTNRWLLDFNCGPASAGSCSTTTGAGSGDFGIGFEPFGTMPWGRWRFDVTYDTGDTFRATLTPQSSGSATTPAPTSGYLKISRRIDLGLSYDLPLGNSFRFQPSISLANLTGRDLSPVGGAAQTFCGGTGSMTTCYTVPGTAVVKDFNTWRGLYGLGVDYDLEDYLYMMLEFSYLDTKHMVLPNDGGLGVSFGVGYRFGR